MVTQVDTFASPGLATGLEFLGKATLVQTHEFANELRFLSRKGVINKTINVGFEITDVAFDGQFLYATDGVNQKVRCLTIEGILQAIYDFTGSGEYPIGICFDGQYLWFTEGINHKLICMTRQGVVLKKLSLRGVPLTNYSYAVAFDGVNFWIHDATDNQIYIMTREGVVLKSFTSPTFNGECAGMAFDGQFLYINCYGIDETYIMSRN